MASAVESDLKTEALVDGPGLIQVLHFRADKKKGWKRPSQVQDLFPDLQKGLPKNFCKKNPETQIQKKFVCQPCQCPIESVLGLVQHCEGAKHAANVKAFDPQDYQKQGKRLVQDPTNKKDNITGKETGTGHNFTGLPGMIQVLHCDFGLKQSWRTPAKTEDLDLDSIATLEPDFCKKVNNDRSKFIKFKLKCRLS